MNDRALQGGLHSTQESLQGPSCLPRTFTPWAPGLGEKHLGQRRSQGMEAVIPAAAL